LVGLCTVGGIVLRRSGNRWKIIPLTVASGFRRLGIGLTLLIVLGAAALATATAVISRDTLRTQAISEIRTVTGLSPLLRGEITVSLFPRGTVSFADVVLGDTAHPALTAERLTARLRFFPLLLGRVEIADISLERPTIDVSMEPDGRSNWSGLIEALARGQKPNAPHPAAFTEIRIDGGTVIVREAGHKTAETVDNMRLSLAWPSISKTFGATGHFIWHGEPVDVSLALGDFAAALAGNRSGLKLRLSAAPMKIAFDGAIGMQPTLKIEGTLAADSPSLREALVWAGQQPLPGGGFGHFALKAATDVVGGAIGLSNVNVELDGNVAEGVLNFATDGRKTLQGTLAAETLDLTPYVSTIRLLTTNQRNWNSGRINLDGLSGIDLDLRLSAANVIMSNAKVGRTAIVANLRGGQLIVTVGEAQAYGGVVKGSLTLANFDSGIDVKSQMLFSDVDLEPCLGQLFGLHRLEGKGNIALTVEGSGDSVLRVTHTLNGTASLTAEKGALAGINVEQLLRQLERRPLSGGGEFHSGRTPYDKITVSMKVAQGTIKVENIQIDGADVRLAMAGSASIPDRELDLKGTAALVAPERPGAAPFELPFVVQGSWDDPIMLPDAEALIHRSGAAAPLLNAARERNARDTVRSVIERLTGGPAAAPVAAIPATEQTAAPAATSAAPLPAQKPE
jgi:AsmA protein